jgi:peptidoglycan LD-endopeptidase CwlK
MLDPHNLLSQVHPDLVKVIETAKQTPQPFEVIYGIRTLAAEEQAVASGHSETLHSRHLPDPAYGNLSMAVDIGVFDNGGVYVGSGSNVPSLYTAVSEQILAASKELGIDVQWGGQAIGAWTDGVVSHFRDWGHYQLDPTKYP